MSEVEEGRRMMSKAQLLERVEELGHDIDALTRDNKSRKEVFEACLWRLAQIYVGIDDLIQAIVIYGRDQTDRPYRIVIRWRDE